MKRALLQAVNMTLGPLGLRVERATQQGRVTVTDFFTTDDPALSTNQREVRCVRNILRYTTGSGSPYSALGFDAGYHSIEIDGQTLKGQRDPKARLALVPFDFADKSVLDIGCNQGGMLFAIADQIRSGTGVDYDPHMINAANRVRSYRKAQHLNFFTFDLEKEPLAFLPNYLEAEQVDIVFLLSVCMWLQNWRDVVAKAASLAPAMLFESNGSPQQQADQERAIREEYATVDLLSATSPDDPMQPQRRLFLCRS